MEDEKTQRSAWRNNIRISKTPSKLTRQPGIQVTPNYSQCIPHSYIFRPLVASIVQTNMRPDLFSPANIFNGTWATKWECSDIIAVYLWLTCQPNTCNLWTRRGITSSLHISRVSCRIWSVLGSDSPSPQSINLIVDKFLPTSSNAWL